MIIYLKLCVIIIVTYLASIWLYFFAKFLSDYDKKKLLRLIDI